MKRIVLFVVLVTISCLCFAQKQTVSIVELNNGSVIRGIVLESAEGTVKIQTADKSVFVYPQTDVVKITEAETGFNDATSWDKTNSIILSYHHALGNVIWRNDPTYGVTVGYYNTLYSQRLPIFLELGYAVGGYSYSKIQSYSGDNYDSTHNITVALPLALGYHKQINESFSINPFLRLMPMLGLYFGSYTKVSFGGMVPDLGVRLDFSHFICSLSYGFVWDTYGLGGRLGQHGINVGVGYTF